jgi:hypothetical protein
LGLAAALAGRDGEPSIPRAFDNERRVLREPSAQRLGPITSLPVT